MLLTDMKQGIHPTYFNDTKVVCACGNTFTTRSIKQSITVDVCSNCHPYFTGEHRFIDTKGRVERFQSKQKIAEEMRTKLASKKSKSKGQETEKQTKSLKELLNEL